MKPPRSFLNKGTSSSTTMPSISEAHEIAHVASAAATNLPSSHMVFVSTEFLSKHKKWTATERSSRAAITRSIARNAGRSRGIANQASSESRPTRQEPEGVAAPRKGPEPGFCRTAPTLFAVHVVERSMIPLHRGAAFLNTANCKHFHGVDHNHAVRFRGRVNHGKLGAAKNHAASHPCSRKWALTSSNARMFAGRPRFTSS